MLQSPDEDEVVVVVRPADAGRTAHNLVAICVSQRMRLWKIARICINLFNYCWHLRRVRCLLAAAWPHLACASGRSGVPSSEDSFFFVAFLAHWKREERCGWTAMGGRKNNNDNINIIFCSAFQNDHFKSRYTRQPNSQRVRRQQAGEPIRRVGEIMLYRVALRSTQQARINHSVRRFFYGLFVF